MIHFICLLF